MENGLPGLGDMRPKEPLSVNGCCNYNLHNLDATKTLPVLELYFILGLSFTPVYLDLIYQKIVDCSAICIIWLHHEVFLIDTG